MTVKRHAQDSPPAAPGATTCNGDSRAAAGLPPPPPQQTDGAPLPAAGCESDVRKLKEVKLMTSRPVELARRQGATLVHLFIYLFISSDRQQITSSTNRRSRLGGQAREFSRQSGVMSISNVVSLAVDAP